MHVWCVSLNQSFSHSFIQYVIGGRRLYRWITRCYVMKPPEQPQPTFRWWKKIRIRDTHHFWVFWLLVNLSLWFLERKIKTAVTHALGHVGANYNFVQLFCFRTRRTDNGQVRRVVQSTQWSHNDMTIFNVATYGISQITFMCISVILLHCHDISQPTLISALQLAPSIRSVTVKVSDCSFILVCSLSACVSIFWSCWLRNKKLGVVGTVHHM